MTMRELPVWREKLGMSGRSLVATNGCFDILHYGHVHCLESARARGDALLVGVNGDASVRRLKGEGRPVNPEAERAALIAALACVDAVVLFHEDDAVAWLRAVAPDLYVKGGDYSLESLNQDERRVVEAAGGRVLILEEIHGKSTSRLVRALRKG